MKMADNSGLFIRCISQTVNMNEKGPESLLCLINSNYPQTYGHSSAASVTCETDTIRGIGPKITN